MEGPPYKKRRQEWISIIYCLRKFDIPKDLIRIVCQCVQLDFSSHFVRDPEARQNGFSYNTKYRMDGIRLIQGWKRDNILDWVKFTSLDSYQRLYMCLYCYGPSTWNGNCLWCGKVGYEILMSIEDFQKANVKLF
jgi:hypothetical protein